MYFAPNFIVIEPTIAYRLSGINEAAATFWQTAKNYRVIAFNGDMGAGKTTFIHALCDHLQVKDVVSSPTFSLISEYHFEDEKGSDRVIFHMDLYRINSEEEAMQAGIEDAIMNKHAYCFIEWASKAEALLPASYLAVTIEVVDDTKRILSCEVMH